MLFGKESKFVGQPVTINDGQLSVEQRYLRAKGRVESLQGKLRRLTDPSRNRKETEHLLTMIDQTKFAIIEWEKRMKVAKFELDLEAGES